MSVRATALAAALAVGSSALGGPPAAAEEGAALSLPTLLEEARRANPNLLAARKRWEAAQARVPLSKALPAPRIGLEWEEVPRWSIKFNQATLIYQLIQSLPFPGKLSLRHQVAVKEAQREAMAFKQAEWETLSDLKSAYYELFLLEWEQEIQREQAAWLTQAAASAQSRYAAGAAPQSELLQLDASRLSALNDVEALTHRREAMAAHLNHLLNRPVHAAIGHPGPVALRPMPFSPDELLVIAQANQPELLAFRFSAERAEAAHRLSKRELLPDLETMVKLRDPAMGPFGPWDLSLAIAIPFWFWTKWRYGIKVAVFDKDSAQAAYQAMQNEIARRVHEHWHEAAAAYRTAKLCEDGLLGLRSQAVTSALAAYRAGRGSFMELLESLRAFAEQRRAYYQHLVGYEQHIVMLEQAAGVPLRASHEDPTAGGQR